MTVQSQSKQGEERWASCAECGDTGLMSALAPCTTFGSDCACNGPRVEVPCEFCRAGGGTRVTDQTPKQRSSRRRIVEAAKLMSPGGGSLETTAAVQVLYLICAAQQDEIDELRAQIDAFRRNPPPSLDEMTF